MPIYNNIPTIDFSHPEQAIRDIHERLDIQSILDVGAGHGGVFDYGYWTQRLMKQREACDKFWMREMSPAWTGRIDVDVEHLTYHYDEKSFDLVQCMEVLEHVPNTREALEELCRVAKQLVIITSADEIHHGYDENGNIIEGAEQFEIEKFNPYQKYIKQPSVEDLQDLGFIVRVDAGTRRQIIAWKYL